MGECAQVVDLDIDQVCFSRPADDAVVQRAVEEFGKDGNDVELHTSLVSFVALAAFTSSKPSGNRI